MAARSGRMGTLVFGVLLATATASLFLIASPPAAKGAGSQAAPPPPVYTQDANARLAGGSVAAFLQRIREKGSLPVIVGLRMQLQAEDTLSPAELRSQSDALSGAQDRVVAHVLGGAPASIKRYTFIPYIAFTVDEAQFGKLLFDPEVASIQEDTANAPKLSGSIPLIHDDYIFKKYRVSGTGQVVAVLDSGVAKAHPMLAGRVVSEACYSTNNPATKFSSFCPGRVTRSTAKGSAVNCPVSIDNCEHGTHVASIAAGTSVGALRGVASGSKIIAIQVFSKVNSAALCGGAASTPCIGYQSSDLIQGLQRVYDLRRTYKIAAANMSLGDDVIYSADCDSQFPAETAAFARLRGAGIAPVVASGNDGSDAGVNSPACISTAITVGNSTKGEKHEQVEFVARDSNMSDLVELMAPGINIRAAVPNGTSCPGSPYCAFSGTSMAAPHVAGAFAVLRQAVPGATVDAILDALKCSGKIVELTGLPNKPRRLARPRIDLLGAYNRLKKIPARTWTFNAAAQALDWTPFHNSWLVSGGKYHPLPPYPAADSYAVISSTANCDASLDVTANMIRVYPKGKQGDYWPLSGIMLKSLPYYQTRNQGGIFFSYTHFPLIADPTQRGFAAIYRTFDSVYYYQLCYKNKSVPVKYNQLNTIRAVSDNTSHKLYINGKLMCSAPNDGRFGPGPVSVMSGFGTLHGTPGGGTFNVDSVTITSKPTSGPITPKGSGSPQAQDELAVAPSGAAMGGPQPSRPYSIMMPAQ